MIEIDELYDRFYKKTALSIVCQRVWLSVELT